MQPVSFEEQVDQLVGRDPRYHREAYFFVREGLDYTQKSLGKSQADGERHVLPAELAQGLKAYALDRYGPLSKTVLNSWGIHVTQDLGDLVFNLIEVNVLAQSERDKREDFANLFDFDEAFVHPFLPPSKLKQLRATETHPQA
jgi:uncharacterized repeat protein (TIGR04138 family)